jgi:hypothetical protein
MSREELARAIEEAVTLNWLVDCYFFKANVAARAKLTKLMPQVLPSRRCGSFSRPVRAAGAITDISDAT